MTDPDLSARIRAALAADPARILRIEHAGRTVWIKRKERLSPLRRLQKGDAAASFETERRGLKLLAAAGMPVPALLDEGPGHMALADAGLPLDRMLREGIGSGAERGEAFAAAGRTLAMLHGRGFCHGRPAVKDMCWDGRRITLIDLERFAPERDAIADFAADLLLFVLSGYTVAQGPSPEVEAGIAAYRAAAPDGVWEAARRRAARLAWVGWLTAPLRLRRAGKAREFKAIPLTLAAFRAT
ncbi:hypothetical protein [Oceaniglobus roseus]|uniref:hypothetical protein n=1 Tax=Oceaniglobus roseus TaxID=1737570 RepID=UPI000C7F0B3A|nr:hypothetical protein [Kandeliimicrobium roseum]